MAHVIDYSASTGPITGNFYTLGVGGRILPTQFWSSTGAITLVLPYQVPEWDPPLELDRTIWHDLQGTLDDHAGDFLSGLPRMMASHPDLVVPGGLPGPENLVMINEDFSPEAVRSYTVIPGISAPSWSFGALPSEPFASSQAMRAFVDGAYIGDFDSPLWTQFRAAWDAQVAPVVARNLSTLGTIHVQSWSEGDSGTFDVRRMTFTPDPNSTLTLGDLMYTEELLNGDYFEAGRVNWIFANEDVKFILTRLADEINLDDFRFSARHLQIDSGGGDDWLSLQGDNPHHLAGELPEALSLWMGDGADTALMQASRTAWADGGAGHDWIELALEGPSQQTITLLGGTGDDDIKAASYMAGGGGFPSSRLYGGAGRDDLVDATFGDGQLFGGTGHDGLFGGYGRDTLDGGLGNDTLRGGDDNDTYITDGIDTITEYSESGTDTVWSVGSIVLTLNVENLVLTGAAVSGTGNIGANRITGNGGNNTLNGGGGADTMIGGAGNDTFITDGGDKTTESASQGTDTVRSSVSLTLGANLENLVLTGSGAINGIGNTLNNRLTGNRGSNTLNGGGSSDTMLGGAGNDTYVTNGGDTIVENASQGLDTVQSSVSIMLGANLERLTLTGTGNTSSTGNTLANTILGNTGANAMNGVAGNDVLSGRAGNDVLNGGAGNDTLTGGTGADSFVFNTALGANNIDRMTDFNIFSDMIRLENAIFTGLLGGTLAVSAFVRNTSGNASNASDRIIYESDTGRLFFDRDGTGAAAKVHFTTLNTNLAMTNADFFVF